MAHRTELATEFYDLLVATVNASATEKQNLRDSFVELFPNHWVQFLTSTGLTDTAVNRGRFVAWMIVFDYMSDVYRAGSERRNRAALPPPETL